MYRRISSKFLCLLLLFTGACCLAQQSPTDPGNGNPIIPGYFADPTVRRFGDTFYIYATTDGNGGGHGPSQVWTSKDFVNWTMHDMNWPTTNYYWAPDVIKGNDSKYYMYYCQPVDIYGASSSTPAGPWTPLLPGNKAIVPNYFVPGVITLDGQTFKDDDGSIYMFWGTWGIYPNHGCGVGLLNPDMHSLAKKAMIPNTVAKEFFEAPFMFKRKGIYYLTYSSGYCENETYRVQYAISRTGPMGPFEFGKNNPVLSTNADGTIHGPGHESVLQVGDDFYMIYHRHNNPHSNGG
ncbi:MAG TPA: family 43 glycosylhydrolase, partial [Mucilaginibacter sp.]